MVMGHSLGEYGALVASGALSFADALEAVSARGREMANVAIEDCGRMAAVFAPLEEIERTLAEVDGYVVIANINSRTQAVIGGATSRRRGGGGPPDRRRPPGGPAAREPRLPHRDRRRGG